MTATTAAPLGAFVSLRLPVVTVILFVDSATATSLVRNAWENRDFLLLKECKSLKRSDIAERKCNKTR